jgi:hypothetical protein
LKGGSTSDRKDGHCFSGRLYLSPARNAAG